MVAGLRVTPETVLGIYGVIMEEVHRLRESILAFRRVGQMPALGGDPVSPCAAAGFNEVTHQLLQQCQAHVDGLAAVGEQLAASARAYGKREEEITATLEHATSVPYVPSPSPT